MNRHTTGALTGCIIACAVFATLHLCSPRSAEPARSAASDRPVLTDRVTEAGGNVAALDVVGGNRAAATELLPIPVASPTALSHRPASAEAIPRAAVTDGHIRPASLTVPVMLTSAITQLDSVEYVIVVAGRESQRIELRLDNGIATLNLYAVPAGSSSVPTPFELRFYSGATELIFDSLKPVPPTSLTVDREKKQLNVRDFLHADFELVDASDTTNPVKGAILLRVIRATAGASGFEAQHPDLLTISSLTVDGIPVAAGGTVATNGRVTGDDKPQAELAVAAGGELSSGSEFRIAPDSSATLSGDAAGATGAIRRTGSYTATATVDTPGVVVSLAGVTTSNVTLRTDHRLTVKDSGASALQPTITFLKQAMDTASGGSLTRVATRDEVAAAAWLLAGTDLTVAATTSDTTRHLQVLVDAKPAGNRAATAFKTGVKVDATTLATPGRKVIQVEDSFVGTPSASPPVTVVVPDNQIARPVISLVQQTDAGGSNKLQSGTASIIGDRLFATVHGPNGAQMELWLMQVAAGTAPGETDFTVAPQGIFRPVQASNAAYSFDVRIGDGVNSERPGMLVALAVVNGRHMFSRAVAINVQPNEVDAATLRSVAVKFRDAADGQLKNPINEKLVPTSAVTVTVSEIVGGKEGDEVRIQTGKEVLGSTKLSSNDQATVTVEVKGLQPGRNALVAQLYRAGVAGAKARLSFEVELIGADSPDTLTPRDLLTRRVGLPQTTGEPVDFPEFTPPRKSVDGVNPSDKVVTRVARLYYFRDAHRVVQIINRRAQSYNAESATMARQLADKARIFAEQTVDRRREAERAAVEAASYARQAENEISRYTQELETARRDAQQAQQRQAAIEQRIARLEQEASLADLDPNGIPQPLTVEQIAENTRRAGRRAAAQQQLSTAREELATINTALDQARQNVSLFQGRASAAVSALEALREREVQEREVMNREQAKEDRAVADQFRLEVRAAREDPDTYAAGNPTSQDPVAQVSLSVIGEGLIQMRGPTKGVNIVHTLINQIDAPVGQVRVGVHTVQVNGERGDEMEEVVARISRYVDHSRFLTAQSAQMLRNAVAVIASRKAQQVGLMCDPSSVVVDIHGQVISGTAGQGMAFDEHAAAQRYQDAFFGAEFIAELQAMDSEFVRTGNKLLSLHSMDTTSLASALFMLALSSNDTRMEILQEFEGQLMSKLPVDEIEYFHASDTKERYRHRKFKFMADNARFVSLRGFHDANLIGNNTLSPVQREFIKLAQILKSRLITEVELKQRVVERALIEERIGNYSEELVRAQRAEQMANAQLEQQQKSLQNDVLEVLKVVSSLDSQIASLSLRKSSLDDLSQQYFGQARDAVRLEFDTDPSGISDNVIFDVLNVSEESRKTLRESGLFPQIASILRGAENRATDLFERGDYDGFRQLVSDTAREIDHLPVTGNGSQSTTLTETICRKNPSRITTLPIRVAQTKLEVRFKIPDNYGPAIEQIKVDKETGQAAPRSAVENLIQQRGSQFDEIVRGTRWEKAGGTDGSPAADTQSMQPENPDGWPEALLNHFLNGSSSERSTIVQTPLQRLFERGREIWDTKQMMVAEVQRLQDVARGLSRLSGSLQELSQTFARRDSARTSELIRQAHATWSVLRPQIAGIDPPEGTQPIDVVPVNRAFQSMLSKAMQFSFAAAAAEAARRPLDHKKFLDMLIDEAEEKYIELVEGTRAHTAVIDDYVKRICTALDDDFNTQFYEPAFRNIREETYACRGVSLGQIEHTTVLTNNREFAKVEPQATMEFDLPRRRIMVAEAMQAAQAAYDDYGALLNDPTFLALTKLNSGQPTAAIYGSGTEGSAVRSILPGLPSQTGEAAVIQAQTGQPEFQSQLEALIPDPAIYKFETGTGFELRPVIQPDGQSVVFDFNYMYTTNVREPVRADEKHLGRVKRHYIDTDVQIGNYELREVSRYRVALKASRTGRGVPLLEDIPVAGNLFRPQASEESSLQQNVILANTVIFPTMFDLMGLRWAPAVADLSVEDIMEQEFTYRNRMRYLKNEVYDYSSTQVDEFLRVPEGERRADLYRTQVDIPMQHPNGYIGPGNGRQDSPLQEGYSPQGLPGRVRMLPSENTVPLSIPSESYSPGPNGYPQYQMNRSLPPGSQSRSNRPMPSQEGRVRLSSTSGQNTATSGQGADARTLPRRTGSGSNHVQQISHWVSGESPSKPPSSNELNHGGRYGNSPRHEERQSDSLEEAEPFRAFGWRLPKPFSGPRN